MHDSCPRFAFHGWFLAVSFLFVARFMAQAYAGNDTKIDTAVMSLLMPATTSASGMNDGKTEEQSQDAVSPMRSRVMGLLRWMFARDAR